VFVEKEVADKEVIDEVQNVVKEVVEDINTAKLDIDSAQVSAAGEVTTASIATTVIIIDVDYQLAQRLQTEEQEELTIKEKAILFKELLEKRRKHYAAKTSEEKRNKPPTQAQQKKIMCTYLKNVEGKKLKDLKNKSFDTIQEMFDKAFKRVNTFVDFKTELVEGEEITQESVKKQKVDDNKKIAELKQLMKIIPDEEEIAIDAILLAVKSSRIVDWKIHKEEKKSYY
ncbi:hypothetical protein Tco_0858396, partial [Tanacetum coccineum]